MPTTLTEQVVAQAVAERDRAAHAAYLVMVRATATGGTTDPGEAVGVLDAAGKTPEQFTADVGRLVGRFRCRELVDGRPELAAERRKVEAEIARVDAELAEAQQRHAVARTPLVGRLAGLDQRDREAEQAADSLARTADPALVADYNRLADQHNALVTRIGHLAATIRQLRALTRGSVEMPRLPGQSSSGWADSSAAAHAVQAKRAGIQLAKAESELASAQAELPDLERQVADAAAKLLVP